MAETSRGRPPPRGNGKARPAYAALEAAPRLHPFRSAQGPLPIIGRATGLRRPSSQQAEGCVGSVSAHVPHLRHQLFLALLEGPAHLVEVLLALLRLREDAAR